MRNHSGFFVADLTQDSLPGQDLYGMVKHDGNYMSRTPRRHIGLVVSGMEKHHGNGMSCTLRRHIDLVVSGMEKHHGNGMSCTLRRHIDLVVFGMEIQIFKVIYLLHQHCHKLEC